MKTDRELLDLAARAAGYSSWDFLAGEDGNLMNVYKDDGTHDVWWPLEDDGDALRLAVLLRLDISFLEGFEQICVDDYHCSHRAGEDYQPDMAAATRRAIVRAAAAIGESMK